MIYFQVLIRGIVSDYPNVIAVFLARKQYWKYFTFSEGQSLTIPLICYLFAFSLFVMFKGIVINYPNDVF
jgi:hypothetical protein